MVERDRFETGARSQTPSGRAHPGSVAVEVDADLPLWSWSSILPNQTCPSWSLPPRHGAPRDAISLLAMGWRQHMGIIHGWQRRLQSNGLTRQSRANEKRVAADHERDQHLNARVLYLQLASIATVCSLPSERLA